jgi:hypothetical protein
MVFSLLGRTKSSDVEALHDAFGIAIEHVVARLHNDANVASGHFSRASECQDLTD